MLIEIDKKSILAPSREIGVNLDRITAYRYGNDVFLTPQNPIRSISDICHEAGHVLGNKYSFKSHGGLHRKNVLSFDDINHGNITIKLSDEEKTFLRINLKRRDILKLSHNTVQIADKLLFKFTLGKYYPGMIDLHLISQDQLVQFVNSRNTSTTSFINNKVLMINSRSGRNSELSSIATETACMLILENSILENGLSDPGWKGFNYYARISPSHQRAQNLVALAFKGKGWRIPSLKDING